MSAHADDLRFYYAEDIGRTVAVTATAGASTPLAEALPPGRYILRVLDFDSATALWLSQGAFGDVVAAATPPSMLFTGHTDVAQLNRPLLSFMVRSADRSGAGATDGLAFWGVGGDPVVQITKISRGRN